MEGKRLIKIFTHTHIFLQYTEFISSYKADLLDIFTSIDDVGFL